MSVKNILAKLSGVKETKSGWSARCPAHEDGTASLSIAEGRDGRVLLKCHAGCDHKKIVSALGLEEKDLFEPAATRTTSMPKSSSKRPRGSGSSSRSTGCSAGMPASALASAIASSSVPSRSTRPSSFAILPVNTRPSARAATTHG